MPRVIKEGHVVNPKTLRQVKIGSAVYKRLVKKGDLPDIEFDAPIKHSEPIIIEEQPARRRRRVVKKEEEVEEK